MQRNLSAVTVNRDYSGARIVRIFAPIGLDTRPNSSNGTDNPINNPEITLEGTKCDFSIPVHQSFARFLWNVYFVEL